MKPFFLLTVVMLAALFGTARAEYPKNAVYESWKQYAVGSSATYQGHLTITGKRFNLSVVHTLKKKYAAGVTLGVKYSIDGRPAPTKYDEEVIAAVCYVDEPDISEGSLTSLPATVKTARTWSDGSYTLKPHAAKFSALGLNLKPDILTRSRSYGKITVLFSPEVMGGICSITKIADAPSQQLLQKPVLDSVQDGTIDIGADLHCFGYEFKLVKVDSK